MKAILFSIGTRGDIEPFLAIAQLLKEKDWEVICVFPQQFQDIVTSMNLQFRGFSKEFLELLEGSPIPGMAHPIHHLTLLGGNYNKYFLGRFAKN